MQVGDLSETDRKTIEAQVAGQSKSFEEVLTEASGLLSGLSRAAGVVLTAKSNQRLKHIEFVRLEPERALVVLVAEDGQVENRVLNIPAGLPTSALIEAANFLNARVRGRTLAEVKAKIERLAQGRPGRTRRADAKDRRRRAGQLVGRRARRAQADRPRAGSFARRLKSARRSGARAAVV